MRLMIENLFRRKPPPFSEMNYDQRRDCDLQTSVGTSVCGKRAETREGNTDSFCEQQSQGNSSRFNEGFLPHFDGSKDLVVISPFSFCYNDCISKLQLCFSAYYSCCPPNCRTDPPTTVPHSRLGFGLKVAEGNRGGLVLHGIKLVGAMLVKMAVIWKTRMCL